MFKGNNLIENILKKREKSVHLRLRNGCFGNKHFGTMNWKDFLYFQRGEKVAVILLLVLIVLVLILNVALSFRNKTEIVVVQNEELIREFEEFRAALQEAGPEPSENRAESRKNYYPPRSTYDQRSASPSGRPSQPRVSSDYVPYPRTEKLAAGETIALNSSDTAEWKKIPGIGSAFADRIVKYRDRLGGFASAEQLREVYGIDNELFARIAPFVQPDENFRKIQINKLEFKELLAHPYLNYKQVQAISNLRRRKGNIASINELAMLDEFTAEDIEKLRAYVEF